MQTYLKKDTQPYTSEIYFSLSALWQPRLCSLYCSIRSGLSGRVYGLRSVQAHWPAETLLYGPELFPLTQQKNSVCCVIILIVL